jgi:hypothetical protein
MDGFIVFPHFVTDSRELVDHFNSIVEGKEDELIISEVYTEEAARGSD